MDISITAYIIYSVFYVVIYGLLEAGYFSFSMPKIRKYAARVQNKEEVMFKPLWPYGVIAYIIYMFAFWAFVLHDIVTGNEKRWYMILFKSTLLAMAIYATFNLTNYVMFEKYSKKLVISDTIWGVTAFNVTAFLLYGLKRYFDKRSA